MDGGEKENIYSFLTNYYANINLYFGEIIRRRLELPNYENCMLIKRIIEAIHKLPRLDEYDDIYDMFTDEDDYEYEHHEPSGKRYKLDTSLYMLDKALFKGERNCDGFQNIFSDIEFSNYQEADIRIGDLLAQTKAFEFLSKLKFKDIKRYDITEKGERADYIARNFNERYALFVSKLSSDKYIETHIDEYDESNEIRILANDISYTIKQKYIQIKKFGQSYHGLYKGIIFISNYRNYFGNTKLENSLYGLGTKEIRSILNRELTKGEAEEEQYKYLDHIVLTTGRNIWKAIIYPSFN